MLDYLLMHLPELQALVRPPVWHPWREGALMALPLEIPGFDPHGRSERATTALAHLSTFVAATAEDFMNFSLAEDYFGTNPYEPGAGDDRARSAPARHP